MHPHGDPLPDYKNPVFWQSLATAFVPLALIFSIGWYVETHQAPRQFPECWHGVEIGSDRPC